MAVGRATIALVVATLLFACSSPSSALPADRAAGIRPEDAKFYDSEIIACRDGSKSFSRERLNDDFCDCADGTDEPGTSACPEGKFYCRNEGSTPQLLFSSRVNDRLCDCCDGSDEYDGGINCSNTCSKNEDVSKNNKSLNSTSALLFDALPQEKKNKGSLEDLVQKLKELKVLVFLEIVLIMMAFRLFHRHIRSRRRWYFVSNSYV
ncbi:hypothetical protein Sjap_000399 [Stephania japonica]|uniref:Glucosidase II beta subunit N-terminal domain-containing protein n=1 Tax=Stephania japonica TaxID=461633 RepID=A0AAP0PSF5_9MAGN